MAKKKSQSYEAADAEEALSAPTSMADDDTTADTTTKPTTTATEAATPATSLQGSVVHMKEMITAPFMIYDAAARRIVPNPAYSRTFLADIRRVQSIPLTKLRTPLQANITYTPKELLYELEAALYCLCAAAAITSDTEPLGYCLSDAEADTAMPQLESFLAQHSAPAKATVVVAHCLTEGTSHEVLSSFISMLEQRVEKELNPSIDRKRTEDEQRALRATKNNLRDIAQLLCDVATAYHCIDTPSQVQRRQPQSDASLVDVARSPAANAVPAQMVDEAYYKVLRWVMAVDTDRRALKVAATVSAAAGKGAEMAGGGGGGGGVDAAAAAAVATAVSLGRGSQGAHDAASSSSAPAAVAAASTAGFATVTDYDPFTGHVTLERASAAQRWGLLLNRKGLLVGLENNLRNSSEAGERLYDAVQQQSGGAGGLVIYEANRRRLRPVHLPETSTAAEEAARQAEVLRKLRDCLTQPTKTLHLSLQKRRQADLTAPQEMLYEVSHQGGEGGVGQRCLLMLERASPSISWGLKLKYLKGAPAVLSDFSPNVRLSDAAKNFLFDMRGRVRVLKMNNKDLAKLSAEEMKVLVSGALILTLQLQVTDANGDVPEEALEDAKVETAPAPTADMAEDVDAAAVAAVEEEEPVIEEAARTMPSHDEPALDDVPAATAEEFHLLQDTDAAAVAVVEEAVEEGAAATTIPSLDQAALDDAAAAIADEFLLHHDRETGDTAEALDADAPAKPTITATGDAIDEAEGEEDDQVAERELLQRFKLLPDAEDADETEQVNAAEAEDALEEPAAETAAVEETKPAKGKRSKALKGSKKKKTKKGKKAPRSRKSKAAAADDAVEGEEEDEAEKVAEEQVEENATPEGVEEAEANAVADKDAAEALPEAVEAEEEAPATKSTKGGKKKKSQLKTTKKGGKKLAEKAKDKKRGRGASRAAAAEKDEAEEEEISPAAKEEDDVDADPPADADAALEADTAAVPIDVPLVDLPPTTAELAMEAAAAKTTKKGEKGKKSKKGKAKAADLEEEKEEEPSAEVEEEKEAAEQQEKVSPEAAADVPLIDLPPTTAELAIDAGEKKEKSKKGKKGKAAIADYKEEETDAAPSKNGKHDADSADADAASPSRVSISELVHAAPLTFENDVQLTKFDGAQLQLERSSVANPWNIKVAFAGDDIIMTKLPPIPQTSLQHPFLRSLGAGAQGEVRWVVEGLNGQDLSAMSKPLKAKALDAIKGSTMLTFALKALRK